jgi:hypothetical protein
VERRRVLFCYENAQRERVLSQQDALVLTLEVRNLSPTVSFAPNDLFFNRQWQEGGPAANKPYTCLEVGPKRYYGGPCVWKPRGGRDHGPREYIEGSEYRTELAPGQTLRFTVCTNPDNSALLPSVDRHVGPLCWRVQLRRGLVRVRDKEGTATAVVGVEFHKADITPG